eukprot:TRINITY_DN3940_c0_g1_i1.p1 TRINITY_DN3940_c0_g1~~TRINITY_DN3940_c0_g1_i1.p1  ORF type:complete len:193 (-),score=12.31 TRINITY_DN3940_c0_g1_i1:156-734(-)
MSRFLREYEGPASDEYEHGHFSNVSCSMSWPSSGPSAEEVPMSGLCVATRRPQHIPDEREEPNIVPLGQKNPLPETGTRRDACGCPSIGSQGHESGRCAGPCKDVRSGRGCTYGKKCKLCHFPHPEVSSTSIRKQQRARVKELKARFLGSSGVDAREQTEQTAQGTASASNQRQQEDSFVVGQPLPSSMLSL